MPSMPLPARHEPGSEADDGGFHFTVPIRAAEALESRDEPSSAWPGIKSGWLATADLAA